MPATRDWSPLRGVNLGNHLDTLGSEPVPVSPTLIDLARRAGFTMVRVPVRWSAHAGRTAPFTIDEGFAELVDRALDHIERRGLRAVINMHHFTELMSEPDHQVDRYLRLWEQVAARYARRPETLAFELLNEPNRSMTSARWNELLPRVIEVVRGSNPTREVIIGGAPMNDVDALAQLRLPDDPHLTATVHYYEPMTFTHQGAWWVDGPAPATGVTWGTPDEYAAVSAQLRRVRTWSDATGTPVLVGEFGELRPGGTGRPRPMDPPRAPRARAAAARLVLLGPHRRLRAPRPGASHLARAAAPGARSDRPSLINATPLSDHGLLSGCERRSARAVTWHRATRQPWLVRITWWGSPRRA